MSISQRKIMISIPKSKKKMEKESSMKIREFKQDRVKESGRSSIRFWIVLMLFVWFWMQEILWEQCANMLSLPLRPRVNLST